MRFSYELTLARRPEEVWRAMDNPENLRKWQPTLVSFEPISGSPGQVGAVSRLTYREGGRTVVLTETITVRRQPEEFAGTYDSSMGTNTIHNRFTPRADGSTAWTVTADFQCSGFMRLMAPFFRGMFGKRMRTDVERFKSMLEAGQLS